MGLERTLRIFTALAAFALLTGCLSTETDITLRSDGSGSIVLIYEIDRAAWDTGVFDQSGVARPIPVTRNEFEDAAGQIEGIRLRSHRTTRRDDLVIVTAGLEFGSVADLGRFLGAESLRVEMNAEGGVWRQVVAGADGSDSDAARALAASLEGYELTFTLRPPQRVASTNGRIAENGSTAIFSIPLAEVVTTTREIVWEVRW